MGKVIDLTGARFGRLLVVGRKTSKESTDRRWSCICDCGAQTSVLGQALRRGATRSCGCYNQDTRRVLKTTHGASSNPLYGVWKNMIYRCEVPQDKDYLRYGGRGITVCQEWHDPQVFIADMSPRPEGHTLERHDNDGPYCKDNCRWATPLEQGSNKANLNLGVVQGKEKHLAAAAREYGVPESTLRNRMGAGRTLEQAVLMPYLRKKRANT